MIKTSLDKIKQLKRDFHQNKLEHEKFIKTVNAVLDELIELMKGGE